MTHHQLASQRCSILRYISCPLQRAFHLSGDEKGKRHTTDLLTQLTQQSLPPRGLHCLPAALHTSLRNSMATGSVQLPTLQECSPGQEELVKFKSPGHGMDWKITPAAQVSISPSSPLTGSLLADMSCEKGHPQLRHQEGCTPGGYIALGVV